MTCKTFQLNLLMHALCLSCCGNRVNAVLLNKDSILNIHIFVNLASCSTGPAAEIDPLAPLPSLHACKEDASGNEYDTPFPVDWRVSEYRRIDNRDIDERK